MEQEGKGGKVLHIYSFNASFMSLTSRFAMIQDESCALGARYRVNGSTGSLVYMAPETIRSGIFDEKSDIFSLGVVIYELIQKTLLLVHVSASGSPRDVEKYAASIADGYRPYVPEVWPPELRKLVCDCWSHDPRKRPSSLEVFRRLENIRDVGMPEVEIHPSVCGCNLRSAACAPCKTQ